MSSRFLGHAVQSKRVRQISPFLFIFLLLQVSGIAHSADRYPEKPWGLDSAAGRCVVCHSLEKNGPQRMAPNLWEIVGAQKARYKSWYAYSPALIRMGGTWTEQDLDAFLADADTFMPGTSKSIKVEDDAERQDIIDFLKTLK